MPHNARQSLVVLSCLFERRLPSNLVNGGGAVVDDMPTYHYMTITADTQMSNPQMTDHTFAMDSTVTQGYAEPVQWRPVSSIGLKSGYRYGGHRTRRDYFGIYLFI